MLRAEAAWIGRVLRQLPDESFPLLNLGSSTAMFRQVEQPWIDALVFEPLRRAGRSTVHVDVRSADGVDVVADITRNADLVRLTTIDYGTVLCSNLLEHLPDPTVGIDVLIRLSRPGQRLVVTGPLRFPAHADPIDNGFRPDPGVVVKMFAGFVKCHEQVVIRDRLMLDLYAAESRHRRLSVLQSLLRPWRDIDTWRTMSSWAFRRAAAFGVLLERL